MLQRRLNQKPWVIVVTMALATGLALPVYGQSASDCAYRAERAARGSSSVVGNAAVGAAGGAAIGAIASSNSRKGARKGAAIGAVAGGASSAIRKSSTYNRVYDDCMAGYYR